MTVWLIDYAKMHPQMRAVPDIARWARASERALKEHEQPARERVRNGPPLAVR